MLITRNLKKIIPKITEKIVTFTVDTKLQLQF